MIRKHMPYLIGAMKLSAENLSKNERKVKMEESEKEYQFMLQVLKVAEKMKKGEIKKIKCPKCGGILTIAKSDYNGHIRATCENGCVNLIQ